jgi:hypothetical protein
MLNSKNICLIFAAGFILPGVLGFIPNPIVSPNGLFVVNVAHNLVHLLTGVAFLLGGLIFTRYARNFLQAIGIIYVIVSIAGLLTPGEHLLGFIHINTADKWLHVGLAALLLYSGFALGNDQLNETVTT